MLVHAPGVLVVKRPTTAPDGGAINIVKKLILAAGLLPFLLSLSVAAHAEIITFGGLPGPDLDPLGVYTEGGFSVSPQGAVLQDLATGNPAPALRITAPAGALTLMIAAAGGGPFTFGSVDVAGETGASVIGVFGFLESGLEYEFSVGVTGAPGFDTRSNAFGGQPIDLLLLIVTPQSENGLTFIDNIVVNRVVAGVPEPASITLVALGMTIAGVARARRPRRTT